MAKHLPNNNVYTAIKAHTYYPIEPKRANIEQMAPPQSTLRADKVREREIDTLRKAYQELKERQEIYIDKLMKLEEGLENQHSQFIKLQQLYTELFQSYKQKQSEILELEMKYRQSDRYREQERENEKARESYRFNDSRVKQYSFREKEWNSKEEQWETKEREWTNKEKQWSEKQKQFGEYIESLKKKLAAVTQNYERVVQQYSIYKSKERTNGAKPLSQKAINQIQEWQKQIDNERESRFKFQYENQFLKNRNADLQTQREQLQKLLAYKQKQINKLRQEKIKIYRQSSEKNIQRSPAKTQKKTPIKIDEHAQIDREKDYQNDFVQSEPNASMETEKQKYFSFSREKHNSSIDSQLPSFPPELEIDSLITGHKK